MKSKTLSLLPLAAGLLLASCGYVASSSSDAPSLPPVSSSQENPSSSSSPIAVTSISIEEGATALVKKGDTLALHVNVTPTNATDKTVEWTTANPEIASVSNGGIVKGLARGQATITAKCGAAQASIVITVSDASITISGEDSLGIDDTLTLSVTAVDVTGTAVWVSSDPSVAAVDQTGKVTGIAPGTTTITVSIGELKSTKAITVLTPKLDAAKMGISDSYEMTVRHTYSKTLVHTGTFDDPMSFAPDAAHNNGVFIPEASIGSSGIYYRFYVTLAGIYRFYSVTDSGDTAVKELYQYDADDKPMKVADFETNDDYSSAAYPNASQFVGNSKDFYTEASLSAGTYMVMVREFADNREDMVFHIEYTGSGVSVSGPSNVVTVEETHKVYRVEGLGYYSDTLNSGVILKNEKAYPFAYDEKEKEYIQGKTELEDFDFSKTAISELAKEGVAAFVKREGGYDYFDVTAESAFGEIIAKLLGYEGAVTKFVIVAEKDSGLVIGTKMILTDGTELKVGLSGASDLSVVVHDYALSDDGEYNGGGAEQDW